MPQKAKKDVGEYVASVRIMGKKYTATGETILKALEALKPGTVAGVAILTVTHGKNTKDRIIPMKTARRLFNLRGLPRDVALKNTSLLFDGI